MYFPYLRGRQFELLALRELAENDLITKSIIPIIEPVKPSATLLKTLSVFNKKGLNLIFIKNPAVGYYLSEMGLDKDRDLPMYKSLFEEINNPNILKAVLFDNNSKCNPNNINDVSIAIVPEVDLVDEYLALFKSRRLSYTLIKNKRGLRRLSIAGKVVLEDNFVRQVRNSDYQENPDEFFSDWHKYFSEEGFEGFSDYSIIGEKYLETGFAPTAVAIHIVYFDDKQELRVHHFVSKSNIGIQDTAGKFGEAVSALKRWCLNKNIQRTRGLEYLYECADTGRFPGLGVVKKYSIMHHLELMSSYLGE